MLKIRCLFITLLVPIVFVVVIGESVSWKEYQKAYGLDTYDSVYGVYSRFNKDVSDGFTATYNISGETHELPVTATAVLLYTKDTIPYWFKSSSMMLVHSYVYGSPLKVSTLHENGSITVKYLGDRFHPLCRNLNCQREDVVPIGVVQKKELVDPSGWGSFQSVVVPFAKGVEGSRQKISDSKLRCSLETE
ncbi:hypothetical protein LOTGIDRAFT_159934 [Lottia gigantea]|uniref:Uncharacterized protein n=1 Tax=Lottia gigantea TaxID=225164 RepID=V3ZYA8_LOTGI|nr:hypothetical protein LOTGIDRAFT_159934 [Lottia gigantea]ESO96518.1 hypothetical protein LOTGIDRAFT_159934 [Lottia gigantea]